MSELTKMPIKLDREEQALLKSIERGEWQSVDNLPEEIASAQKMAEECLRKNMRINIRLSSGDLERIKRIAAYEGLHYQTLISSILHKYACGHLNSKRQNS